MNQSTHRCMIVPASHAEFARGMSSAIAKSSGDGMWTTPLSPTGLMPATHFISVGLIDTKFADLMPLTQYPFDAEPIHTKGQISDIVHLAAQAGFDATAEQVQLLFDNCDCSEQMPHEALARVGLVLASESM